MRKRARRAASLPVPTWLVTSLLAAILLAVAAAAVRAAGPPAVTAGADPGSLRNPAIDVRGYLEVSREAARHRRSRRLSEADFIRMSREPGTVVLDARSREKYDELHVKGAVHLSFPDIAYETLERLLPDKGTRILIYCNNNFTNADGPFPRKAISASLNVPTYIALYTYGYRNVYELGPLIDIRDTRLEFESSGPAPGTPE